MNCLLDTHSFIWFSEADPKLPPEIKARIEDKNNSIFLSMASLWEIAIKLSLNKLELKKSLDAIILEIENSRIQWLHIKPKHIGLLKALPFLHRDPFDRLIIAQAM